MAKKANDSASTAKIRNNGVFFLPAGAITSELHLAAFLETSRRTVVDTVIHPAEHDGVHCMRVGPRFVFRIDDFTDHVKQHSGARKRPGKKGGNHRPRKKGGNRRCDDDPPCSK